MDNNNFYKFSNLHDKNDLKFIYGHYKVDNGVATLTGVKLDNKLFFGVAFCSPNDNFSRAIGRKLSKENLLSNSVKKGVLTIDEKTDKVKLSLLLKMALENYVNNFDCRKPSWFKNIIIDFRNKK